MNNKFYSTLLAFMFIFTNSIAPAVAIADSRRAAPNTGVPSPAPSLYPATLLLNEGFEAGAAPPGDWSEVVTNPNYNWDIAVYGTPHSGDYAANVDYDDYPNDQDEWLLSPEIILTQGVLSFWSQGSVYWCRDTKDNCDLNVWIVVGEAGGADDISLGEADSDWPASWIWAESTFNLTSLLPGGPVRIGFEYVGNDGAQVLLDDITLDGSGEALAAMNLSGTIEYWNGVGVSDTMLTLEGETSYYGLSGLDGAYLVSGVAAGDYLLTPVKTDEINGISAYDASLALQHAAGLIPLSGSAAAAADVDNSGTIGTMDASYILQKAIGLIKVPFPGSASAWEFTPPSYNYANLNANQIGQDFVGVLLGDPSGNWQPGGSQAMSIVEQAQTMSVSEQAPAMLSLQSGLPAAGGQVTVAILLNPAGAQITSLDLKLSFDPDLAQIVCAEPGSLVQGWIFAHNEPEAGEIWIGLAGSQPVGGNGSVATLVFQMQGTAGISELHFLEGSLNEGSIPVTLVHGRIGDLGVFLPIITK